MRTVFRVVVSFAAATAAIVLAVALQRYFQGSASSTVSGAAGFGAVLLTWLMTAPQ